MSTKRTIYFSRLKALACIAVVLLHTFYAASAYCRTTNQLRLMMTVRNLMSWAVPCFVMVTGALLLDKGRELGYKKLFSKHILRMAVTLVVFTLLFNCFDALFVTKNFSFSTITDAFEKMLFGGGWKHMWYLYLMIALYLMMPAYRLVTKSAKNADILYIMGVYAVFLCVLPNIDTLTGKSTAFYICVYSVYPLYLFLGYALHNGIIKLNAIVSLVLFAAGLTATALTTIYTTGKQSRAAELLNNYAFIATVAAAAGAFGLMQAAKDKDLGIIDKIAAELEKCSFGIYILHMAALKTVFVIFKFDPIENGGFFAVLGISLAVLLVCYAAVRLLKLVKGVNKII